jgi:hypothetical protein
MTTPTQRISRLLDEEARFVAYLPGNIVIDVTADVTAALAEVQMGSNTPVEARNLLITND